METKKDKYEIASFIVLVLILALCARNGYNSTCFQWLVLDLFCLVIWFFTFNRRIFKLTKNDLKYYYGEIPLEHATFTSGGIVRKYVRVAHSSYGEEDSWKEIDYESCGRNRWKRNTFHQEYQTTKQMLDLFRANEKATASKKNLASRLAKYEDMRIYSLLTILIGGLIAFISLCVIKATEHSSEYDTEKIECNFRSEYYNDYQYNILKDE